MLFCKLSALRVRVHHVDTNHCDLHMTSKMKGRSFFKILWNLPQLCKCLLHWVSFCFWVYLNLLDFLADLSLIFTWILHPGLHCKNSLRCSWIFDWFTLWNSTVRITTNRRNRWFQAFIFLGQPTIKNHNQNVPFFFKCYSYVLGVLVLTVHLSLTATKAVVK